MSYAGTIRPSAKDVSLPIIETPDDFLAFAGLFENKVSVKKGTGNPTAFTQTIEMDYVQGVLRLEMGTPVADRLPAFFEKNNIAFKMEDSKTPNGKVVSIPDLDSWRKLAVWGVPFVGSNILRQQHEAEQNRMPAAAVARSA